MFSAELEEKTSPGGLFRAASAARTDTGLVRALNEDAYLNRPDIGVWVVADGMGGHDAGDYASRLIVETIDGISGPVGAATLLADVRVHLTEVNRLLRVAAGGSRMIGSTVVVLLAHGAHYCCLWAGDSRIYMMRNGRLTRITRDHSHVQELVDRGALSPEAAEHHPFANIITRAVGVENDLKLDKVNDRLQAGDVFLLCSDGLTKEVDDAEIFDMMRGGSCDRMVDDLVDLALRRGGSDNVTAITVEFDYKYR